MSRDPEVRLRSTPPEAWDGFVRHDPRGSFCHLAGWGEVFRSVLGLEPLFLVSGPDDAPDGVLPVYRMKRLPWGTSLVSVPYLNYGGPLGPEEVRKALLNAAVDEAERGGDRRLEVRTRHPCDAGLAPGRDKVAVVLDLPDEPRVLFEDEFRSKLRSQIRRPMKEDMEVRFGPDQRGPFYDVFSRTMRDLGTPVLPGGLFEAVAGRFPDLVLFGAVYHEGEPVAVGCGFRWQAEFEMTWASALWEYNRLAPNMLLYWSFMERCIEEGMERFNFGRCTPGGGTHRFKTQWGGRDEPLPWLQWPEGAAAPEPDSGLYELATSAWRKLPLPVANRLGPVLARRIPTF